MTLLEQRPLILVVDDDEATLRFMTLDLQAHGFRVMTASNGKGGLAIARDNPPDAVLLDLMLPDMSGLEVMRRLKQGTSVPVLLVTGIREGWSRVQGLDLGADDYVLKPFNLAELRARIEAVLRRTESTRDEVLTDWTPGLEMDPRGVALRDGKRLELTPVEWRLLEALAANPGRILSPEELLASVWGTAEGDRRQLLRVTVSRLRVKLHWDPDRPDLLHTITGFGYFFGVKTAASRVEPVSVASIRSRAAGPEVGPALHMEPPPRAQRDLAEARISQ